MKDLLRRFKEYHSKEDLVEEVIQGYYKSFLQRGISTAIDCGCHKGYHSIPLSLCCKNVVGIDANEEMCHILSKQLKDLNITNCTVINSAVQDLV